MYQLNVAIHIIAACIWVGGLIYTAAVVVPEAIKKEQSERQRMLRAFGRRFRWIGWGAVVVLVVTGLGNLTLRYSPIRFRQLINGEVFDPTRVDGFIAVWLPWKLLLVVTVITLMLIHDVTSTASAKGRAVDPDAAPGNKMGTRAAALATLLSLAIIYVSVRLVRG